MRNIPKHIIDRLKQQPRQGAGLDLGEEALNTFDKSMNNLLGTANSTTAGVGILIQKAQDLSITLKTLSENTNFLEQRTSVLAKTFGLNVAKSTEFYGRLAEMSEEMGVGASKIVAYTANLKKLIGSYANLQKAGSDTYNMKQMLTAQKILQNQLGLTEEQANTLEIQAALQKKSSTEQLGDMKLIADFMIGKGYDVNVTDVLADMAALSADTVLQYGKMPGNLQLAVTKARLLGTSMAQLNKTGMGLLNIESSIGDEMEYQLLSGRRLVNDKNQSLTNLYRQATIQGNASKQADLMNQIVEQEGDTIRDNLFARQQLAKTLGIEESQLARTLAQQELLKRLQAEGITGANAEELAQNLKNSNVQEKEALAAELAKVYDQRTTDERMADSIDIMAATMLKAFGSPITMGQNAEQRQGNLMDMSNLAKKFGIDLADIDKGTIQSLGSALVGTDAGLTYASPIMDLAKAIGGGMDGIKDYVKGIATGATKLKITADEPIKVVVAETTNMQDGAFGPGAASVVLGPAGAFSLNKQDSVIAGTNLGGSGGGDMSAFAAAIVSAINNQTAELTRDNTYWS